MTVDHYIALPDTPIATSGMISMQFRHRGIETFRSACQWVHEVPYGANSGFHNNVLFDENRGTCRSKHGVIALLASELGLPVRQYVGGYRLDESIVEGIGPVLAAHGLSYVPQLHCVLKYQERFIDLTAGNCHGKKQDVNDMDIYVRVSPFASDEEDRTAYTLVVQYYQRTDPALSRTSVAEVRRIARACSARSRLACAVA